MSNARFGHVAKLQLNVIDSFASWET